MVVYCIKFVLRGENPRDYVDMLRSLAFPLSINTSDMPHRIATHANRTVPHFFRPNDGRIFPPTEENIDAAKEGRLVCHLPCVRGSSILNTFQGYCVILVFTTKTRSHELPMHKSLLCKTLFNLYSQIFTYNIAFARLSDSIIGTTNMYFFLFVCFW